jgi:ABC-type glycerol-3-phosphate transport system substrate-binding protein
MEPEKIKKIAIISAISVFVIGLIVYLIFNRTQPVQVYKVNIEIWGLFDDSDAFSKEIIEYKKRNPYVGEITYKKMPVDSYENDLLDAMATGKGPDIFLIHNSWLSRHKDKLAPAPENMVDGKPVPVVSAKQVQDVFPDVVTQDFVKDSKVYALPSSIDSLALYVNKDYLNQAGISRMPQTWLEFDDAVKKMTKIDSSGIQISGAAMGASSDASVGEGKINRATDILTLLMLQSGAEMVDDKGNMATFANFIETSPGKQYSPGQMALEYYTKFSNRSFSEYCWNSLQHNSVDSFIEGKTAMMLNYSWLLPKIELKAPKLNLGIAPVPQNKDQQGKGLNIDFANYWGFAVSRNKITDSDSGVAKPALSSTNDQRIYEAWQFLRYLTMNPSYSQGLPKKPVDSESAKFDPAMEYATKQKKPAARRDLIEIQKNDPVFAPFAEGNLIARSWPQFDNLAVEKIFDEMIDDVALRNENSLDAINQAQNSVNLLMRK